MRTGVSGYTVCKFCPMEDGGVFEEESESLEESERLRRLMEEDDDDDDEVLASFTEERRDDAYSQDAIPPVAMEAAPSGPQLPDCDEEETPPAVQKYDESDDDELSYVPNSSVTREERVTKPSNPFVDEEEDEVTLAAEDFPQKHQQQQQQEVVEEVCLPLSLSVCAHGHSLRLRSRHAWSVPLDSEVKWSHAGELCATVLVSFGFVCRELCTGDDCAAYIVQHACGPGLPALIATRPHQPTSSSSSRVPSTSSLRLVVASGALASKRRALVAGVAAGATTPSEDALAGRALAGLRSAVEESFLRSHRLPDPSGNEEEDATTSAPSEIGSADDSTFVADLRRAFAAELDANLVAYAKPLDDLVAKEELRSAQLMALLAPAYSSAGVTIPRPARAPALTSFPLIGARPEMIGNFPQPTMSESTTDIVAKELVATARRKSGDISEGFEKVSTCTLIIEELREWSGAEAAARTRRKAAAVSARLRNAESHAVAVVRTLSEDRKKSKKRISLFTSSTSERKFASLFRVADTDGDALFYDCPAFSVPDQRNSAGASGQSSAFPAANSLIAGRLYVAASGCYWHSSGVLGMGSSQSVVPYFTLDRIELREGIMGEQQTTTPQQQQNQQQQGVGSSAASLKAGALRAAAVAARAMETVAKNLADEQLARVALIDTSGNATIFFLPPSPTVPENAQRVVDLLQIAKKVNDDFRRKSTSTTSSSSRLDSSVSEPPKRDDDEIAILERVQKIAEISARNAKLLDPPPANDAGSFSSFAEKAMRNIPASFPGLSSSSRQAAEKPPLQPVDDRASFADLLSNPDGQSTAARKNATTPAAPPKPPQDPKKRLSNLQAFLDQAHQQKEQK